MVMVSMRVWDFLGTPLLVSRRRTERSPGVCATLRGLLPCRASRLGAEGGAALLTRYIGRRGAFATEWTTTNSASLTVFFVKGRYGIEPTRYRRTRLRRPVFPACGFTNRHGSG